jgi:hypothetical protein
VTQPFPISCEIHSHQYYAEGVCYGVGISSEQNRPYALIVTDSGEVRVIYLDGVYSVKLKV